MLCIAMLIFKINKKLSPLSIVEQDEEMGSILFTQICKDFW